MSGLNAIEQETLFQIAGIKDFPEGAYNVRVNGHSAGMQSDDQVQIVPKADKSGLEIHVQPGVKNETIHIPVLISQSGLEEVVYNDFYIGENSDVLIVAGCGIHNDNQNSSEHNGIHSFHLGKNCKVKYIEKHLGLGSGAEKILNPTTSITMEENSSFEMETVQLGGVSSSARKTKATLKDGAHLVIIEKIKTNGTQTASTDFVVNLNGKNCSAKITSRSVASDNSFQKFDSKIVGNNSCFGHIECDGLLSGNARIVSIPQIDAKNSNAQLVHEATIGKIANEQLIKLSTLGLSEKEAEELIIKAYLK